MSLTYCEGCQQIEGETQIDEDGTEICAACGEPTVGIPEHDDMDMER